MPENGFPDRSHLPTSPGVYIFKDAADTVLYVGKAKNVRARVASYFNRSGDGRPKIAELRERVRQIDFIVTGSETEALVLEANLIKRHRPRFNASLKDDKSYPYIVVTTGDEYPRVFATRAVHDPRHRYFGPFPSAGSVHATLDVLNKTFPFRKCRGPEPGRRSGVPCLNYHIGRSAAPCIGAISKEDYDGIIADVISFLEGRVDGLIREREAAMREAATDMDFERAAKLRDEISALSHVRDRQQATIASEESFDAFGAYSEGETACVQVFAVREGQIVNRDSFLLDNYGESGAEEVTLQFVPQYYGMAAVPREVLVQMKVGDVLPDIPLRSLAKRDEEIFEPGRPEPVVLERNSPELHLLQRVRDEAHRFANAYHTKLRGRAMTASVLDDLPGVGPERKKKILAHFGTPEAFLNASLEELESVPGLPGRVAREVHARVHR